MIKRNSITSAPLISLWQQAKRIGVIQALSLSLPLSSPPPSTQVNIGGFHNIIELCRVHKLKLFCPSTIGAFGPDSQKVCPDLTVQRPKTVYGVSKVHMELLGEVYNKSFNHPLSFIFFLSLLPHSLPLSSIPPPPLSTVLSSSIWT